MVALLTVLAAVLRLFFLGRLSIWGDEGASIEYATRPFRSMLDAMVNFDPNMLLYHLLLRLWMKLGDSEAFVRLLSVACAVAAVPVFCAMAKRLTDTRTAIVATLLLAINSFAIRYAQEARGYSMGLLLVIVSWLYFVRSRDAPTSRNLAGYVATSALGVYVQVLAILSYLAQWIAVVVFPGSNTAWRRLIPAGVAVAMLSAPMIILSRTADVGQLAWVLPLSFAQVQDLVYSFSGVLTGGPAAWLLPGIFAMLAFGGFIGLVANSYSSGSLSRDSKLHLAFITVGFLLPIGAVYAVSFKTPMFIARYMFLSLPFYLILVAAGLCTLKHRAAFGAALSVVVALSMYQDYRYFRFFEKDDWRGAATYVFQNARPGDGAVLFDGFIRWAYDYYSTRAAPPVTRPALISPNWDDEFRVDGASPLEQDGRTRREAALLHAISDAPGHYARIWLVLCSNENPGVGSDLTTRKLLPAMDQQYRFVSERDFSGIRVLLYDRRSPASAVR